MFRSNSKQSGGIRVVKLEKKKRKGCDWKGFTEKEGIKPRMKEWVGDKIE